MSESVTGYIDHVIFRNEENGYTVMILKGVEDEEELTCVGSFPVITMGASVELTGNYIQHPVYGKQFQAATLTEKMPEDAIGKADVNRCDCDYCIGICMWLYREFVARLECLELQ